MRVRPRSCPPSRRFAAPDRAHRPAASRHPALLSVLLLLAAACGQKSGVAQLSTGGPAAAQVSGDTTTGDVPATDIGVDTGAAGVAPSAGAPAAPGTRARPASGAATGTTTTTTTTAAGPQDRTGITATEIRIGIHAPITGAAAVSTFEQGVGVYSASVGKVPGLGNREIKVVYRDDKFDPTSARQACQELIEKEKVFLLIGGAGADQIQSCAQYAQSVGVPYFSPGVSEGGFLKLPNYFALSETYNQQNQQIAQLIKNQVKKSKLGIVLTDSPLLSETEANIKQAASANAIDVVEVVKVRKDANKGDTDSAVSKLKGKADVVYALISPTVFGFFVASAREQQYFPSYVGPGLSLGLNLVAKVICQPPFPDMRYLSPMVQMDKIDQYDAAYRPAYQRKNGSASQPDDIGILLWGLEKTIRLMLEAVGPDVGRQSLVKTLESGKEIASNVYAPVKFGGMPHFGADKTTLLTLNCSRLEFDTTAPFVSSF